MTLELTDSLLIALTATTLVSSLLAVSALIVARRARQHLSNCAGKVEQLEQAMQSAASILAESDARLSAACTQIDGLAQRQGTLDAAGSQPGFQQAIALTQRGASSAEVMEICGVSQGEARLIQTMYGQAASGAEAVAAN